MIWADRWTGAALRLACLLDPELAARMDLQRLQATTPQGMAPLPFDQSYRAQRSRPADLLGLRAFIQAAGRCSAGPSQPGAAKPQAGQF